MNSPPKSPSKRKAPTEAPAAIKREYRECSIHKCRNRAHDIARRINAYDGNSTRGNKDVPHGVIEGGIVFPNGVVRVFGLRGDSDNDDNDYDDYTNDYDANDYDTNDYNYGEDASLMTCACYGGTQPCYPEPLPCIDLTNEDEEEGTEK